MSVKSDLHEGKLIYVEKFSLICVFLNMGDEYLGSKKVKLICFFSKDKQGFSHIYKLIINIFTWMDKSHQSRRKVGTMH